MTKRELYNVVELGDSTYRVKKMTALDGGCLFKFVAEKLLPSLQKLGILSETPEGSPVDVDGQTMETIISMLHNISNSELRQLMIDCLNVSEKSLKAGWQPVMIGRNFGVAELEYDTMTCLQLCANVIVWNFSDFFGGNGLNLSLVKPNTSKQNQ